MSNKGKFLWSAYCSKEELKNITQLLGKVFRIQTTGKSTLTNLSDNSVVTDTESIAGEVIVGHNGNYVSVNPDGNITYCSYNDPTFKCDNKRCPFIKCPVGNISVIEQEERKKA